MSEDKFLDAAEIGMSLLTEAQSDQVRTTLPPLPTWEELELEKSKAIAATVVNPFKPDEIINLDEYREKLANSLVTSETIVPPEKPIISIDGYGIFTKSDVHLVKAKAKAGKTTMLKIIIATILSGQLFRIKSLLENPKIVWFDTEQSMADTHRIIKDVVKLSGLSPKEVDNCLSVYHLRKYFCDELKASLVTALIYHKPDVLIVDGVVDMVESFNDERESRLFVRSLIALSEEYDCSIIQVLHTNKAQEDHNPRGHLGTCDTNASETVVECEKKGNIFTVKCTETRHAGMPEWHFMYDSNGNIVSADELHCQIAKAEEDRKKAVKELEAAKQVAKMLNILKINGGKMKRSELVLEMDKQYNIKSTKAYDIINAEIGKSICIDCNMVQVSQEASIPSESS